jgi:3-oxoacyl-[acyl-carrier-protein] synthase II
VGVYLGSGIGGIDALEQSYVDLLVKQNPRTHPYTVIRTMANAAAGHISMDYGLRGPNVTISTACSSSAYAIGEAYRQIKHGYCDMMVAGGTEALLSFGVLNAWEAMRTTAPPDATDVTQSCRPFSKDRAGLVLGEGAGILILETLESARARGATIYAEVAGFGASSDAGHITKPSFEGQSVAMRRALQDAGLHPEDIDHVNAHGTATQVGDVEETKAIKNVFGAHAPRIAVSSTKSMHGHLMGATGAVEFIASVLAVKHQAVPATAHLRVPDPECDLDYVPNVGRVQAVRAAMSNSFAFGGSNAVLVAKAA